MAGGVEADEVGVGTDANATDVLATHRPVILAELSDPLLKANGSSSADVIRTLQARGYVAEVGRDHGPGQANLYGTTPTFLEKLGLDSLTDLPPIAEFVPGADVVEALEHGLRIDPPDESPRA